MRTKKGTVAVAAVIVILLGIVCVGLFQDFDAQGYVLAILEQRFQGEVTQAKKIIKEAEEEELVAQYESGIEKFVEDHITGGIDTDAELEAKFGELCKKIFASMKYEVHEAEKISRKEYRVNVEIEPSDIFIKFVEGIQAESARLSEKVEKGEYRGTKEEIHAQMQKEFLENSYKLLEESYENRQYGEPEIIEFQVVSDENNIFSVRENEISLLITKILRLDEIQD